MISRSEAFRPRLVCWLPVVDEVRTRIYGMSRESVILEEGLQNVDYTYEQGKA
jgi:hypothetical protein